MAILDLKTVDPELWAEATQAFTEGDAGKLMVYAENHNALALVFDNLRALKDRGIYEQALLDAWIGHRMNHSHWSDCVVAYLFQKADPAKVRAAGDPVPECPIVVYRGISGHGRRRRKLGWS